MLVSALAGGGLTAAGLGALVHPALGAESAPIGTPGEGTLGSGQAPGTPEATGAGEPSGAEQPPSTTTTTAPTTTAPTATTTAPAPTTTAPASGTVPIGDPSNPSGADRHATPPEAPKVVLQRKQSPSAAKRPKRSGSATGQKPSGGTTKAKGGPKTPSGPGNVAPAPGIIAAQAGAFATELANSAASVQALAFYRIPLFLLPIYQAAAVQYGVPWQVLAAINEIETNYGTDLNVSSAGAEGWMQFMPATWLQYGVDALNSGYADPYNPVDAIFAAARYLRAAGAAHDLRAAVLAYNHSDEYLNSVLLRAKLISAYPKAVIATLTALSDGRPPLTGGHLSWGLPSATAFAPPPASSASRSSATAGASPVAASAQPGAASAAQAASPLAAAAAAVRGGAGAAQPLQLVDVRGKPNASVVAVEDGRVLKIGHSSKLGRFVVLRDVYGDVFTYAGLGSIAPRYKPKKVTRSASDWRKQLENTAAIAQDSSPTQPASAGSQPPLTLSVGRAGARKNSAASAASAASAEESTRTISAGKVRLFAHPGNPDAQLASRGAASRGRAGHGDGSRPLRPGSVVSQGTVLGHARVPPGAQAGHLRFAIRPAGDRSTIDPRPILGNWLELQAALHPAGAPANADLLGATATGVFLFSEAELERAVLADPNISIYPCGRRDIASGAIDRRVLAVLAFLSRSGLSPTVSALRCGHSEYTVSGYVSEHYTGDALDISAINGTPILGHQGPGTITDLTIRALLTLQGPFAPHQIISLMRYPEAANTLAMPDHYNHIHVGFRPVGVSPSLGPGAAAAASRAGRRASSVASSTATGGGISAAQWDRLIQRISALPTPVVARKPSAAAIHDKKHP
jgi:Transglycosylase SLT domain